MELQTTTIDINDSIQKFEPKVVLVAYKSEGQSRYYLEQSDVKDGIPAGFHPASVEDIKSLFSSVTAADSGYIKCGEVFPRNVIHLNITGGDFRVVWHRNTSVQLIKFDKALKIPSIRIRVPGMVYDATRGGLKVYAVKHTALKATVFQAPYMNIMGDDSVCFGNTKIDIPAITSLQEIMYEYEKVFWGSEFTDSGSTDYLKMWKNAAKSKVQVFDKNLLREHKKYKIIKDIIS